MYPTTQELAMLAATINPRLCRNNPEAAIEHAMQLHQVAERRLDEAMLVRRSPAAMLERAQPEQEERFLRWQADAKAKGWL